MKIREKIRALVWRRLEIMGPAREAVRRALAILAMPQNLPLGLRVSWRSADLMWRHRRRHQHRLQSLHQAHDARRGLRLDPARLARRRERRLEDTAAFLDRRIDDVMKFEKLKAEWRGSSERRLSVSRFLGRLRYPPR